MPGLLYCGPVLALLVMTPAVLECGAGYSLLVWLSASVLGFLLSPDREAPLLFLAVGWYPALREKLCLVRHRALCLPVKLLALNTATALVYGLGSRLLLGPAREPAWLTVLLWLAANLCFLLCDLLLTRTARLYRKRFWRG